MQDERDLTKYLGKQARLPQRGQTVKRHPAAFNTTKTHPTNHIYSQNGNRRQIVIARANQKQKNKLTDPLKRLKVIISNGQVLSVSPRTFNTMKEKTIFAPMI